MQRLQWSYGWAAEEPCVIAVPEVACAAAQLQHGMQAVYGMPWIATPLDNLNQASSCPATHLQLGNVFFSVEDQRPPDAVGHQRHACRA